jgi:UPF0755 protein
MKLILRLVLLAGLAAIVGMFALWQFAQAPLAIPDKPHAFVVKPGSNIRTVSRQLVDEGILSEPWRFIIMARVTGRASDLKAGNYLFGEDVTPYRLFNMLTSGDVSQIGITFIEGWTFRQMREELNRHEGIEHLGMGMSDLEILRRIGAVEPHPEGLFFPDTYYFTSGMTDLDILKRAYEAMQAKLEAAWLTRVPGLPYRNAYEALIMASIVEKETGRASERPRIARVFINRLRLGMRLQTDPTVIYGMGEGYDGNIRRRDLLADTPYNTYTRSGLPPTPIANPGMGAIAAALNPDKNPGYLYFVGRGDGSHAFSKTLAEHNRAVARYQLGRN